MPVETCLRNVVTLFHHIEKEIVWRKENGREEGFESLKVCKPLVAVGAKEPLSDEVVTADYFHGVDGLGGIHDTHPHFSLKDPWRVHFGDGEAGGVMGEEIEEMAGSLFRPVRESAADAILRLLRENEPDSITIVAIGPLTNLAIAAAKDAETFLRAKDVIIMGGALGCPGNVRVFSFYDILVGGVY